LERQINVKINPVILASYNLSPQDVAQAIAVGAGLFPAGNIETRTKNYNLRIFSEYSKLEDIRNTIVTVKGNQKVYVKDIAEVEDGYKELTTEVRAEFGEGIIIVITKQSDANTVLTSRGVIEALPDIKKQLPQGTEFTVIWNQSDFILRSIKNLSNTAIIAFIMAFIVIYFFLRNWRGSIIMGIAMPLSIVATFAVLFAANLTLNIISMAGLALAVGMLVDNSIVVLENIYRHRELGESSTQSADSGASEVGMAITASTLTTISVFLPVLFVPNITGQLFKDMVLTITFSLVVSLLIALTLVPMMSANILKVVKNNNKSKLGKLKNKIGIFIDNLRIRYELLLRWSINRKKTVLGIVLLSFVISLGLTTFLGGEFLPKTDQGFMNIIIESPAGNTIEQTRLYAFRIEDILKEEIQDKDLESLSILYGEREGFGAFGVTSSTIELFVKLSPVEERNISVFEYQDSLRKRFNDIPGITYIFQEGGALSNEKGIEVKILGFDIDGAKAIADNIKAEMEKIEGFVDIALNVKETVPELQIELDKDILNKYGLSYLGVAANVSTAIQGSVVSRFRQDEDEYDIRVQFDKEFRKSKEAIEQIQLAAPGGQMVQLKDLAVIKEEQASPTIFRENQNRFVSVGCNLSGIDLSNAVNRIEEIISQTPIPSEYQVIIGGTAEDQEEAFFYLGLAFIAAILLVYMIMASQFESLVYPLIIMFTVPLSVIGVFTFLFITGTSLSVMALVGLVMLVGISVNNGIVMVDYINQVKAEGIDLLDSVIEGSLARMRPVLMTAMTTILGMVPLAVELGTGAETWSPLARAVIGGLFTTTILTLIVVPIMYIMLETMSEKFRNFIKGLSK